MIGTSILCCYKWQQLGMCFGAFLRAKKENNKTAIFSSFVSAFIGITEPALYGVAFRFKKPLIALMIGGGISGAFASYVLVAKAISFAMPSITFATSLCWIYFNNVNWFIDCIYIDSSFNLFFRF